MFRREIRPDRVAFQALAPFQLWHNLLEAPNQRISSRETLRQNKWVDLVLLRSQELNQWDQEGLRNWSAMSMPSNRQCQSHNILPQERLLLRRGRQGSVDGVTGANTLTEDGMAAREGLDIIAQLRELTGFTNAGGNT